MYSIIVMQNLFLEGGAKGPVLAALCVIVAYFLGNISPAILIGRLHGIDQSGLHGRPPSVHQKCFFRSVSVDKGFRGFSVCPASEHQFRRISIRKKFHTTLPLNEKRLIRATVLVILCLE